MPWASRNKDQGPPSWPCPEEMAESQRKMTQCNISGSPANEPYFPSLMLKQPQALEPTPVDGGRPAPGSDNQKATAIIPLLAQS